MTNRREQRKDVSRRDVLKAAGGGAALAGMAGGCAAGGAKSDVGRENTSAMRRLAGKPGTGVVKDHVMEGDVVVVGGGMAGVCAAIAAARNGARVVLVQDRPVLGGNASSEVRVHVCGADASGSRTDTDSRESGIIEEIRLEDAVRNPQRSASMYDLLLYEWVRRESNITLLLNTHCRGVEMSGQDRISAVRASRHNTEDTFTIRGKLFIDGSGDGRLGAEAGAQFRMGREGQGEFNESMAPLQADNKTLGSSITFITRQHDRPMPFAAPDWIRRFPKCEDLPHRPHGGWEWGFWWVEWGGDINTIKDAERIRDELAAAALGVWDHIKNSGQHPDSANWALEWFGFVPGKRESRRFIGDYVLTQRDVQTGEVFEDGVAYGGWPIDLHPPGGIDSKEPPYSHVKIPLYNIPLRCLYSRNIANLLFAGRDASISHVAFGSTRIMATGAVMGQAAGTAAALCARHGCTPRELGRDGIRDLQQQLLKDDAYIIGARNSDPLDLARVATVAASSEIPQGRAANVIDGVQRGVFGESHRWISDPARPLPQSIELRFAEPKRVREVHLVFDTGLNRARTLTHADYFNAKMVPGPQPEAVRDYQIELLEDAAAMTVARVQGNHQRHVVHRFEPHTARGIRLLVQATNGDKSARVFEIRAYT